MAAESETNDAVMQVGPNADFAVHGRRAIRRLLATQLRGAKTLGEALYVGLAVRAIQMLSESIQSFISTAIDG